MEKWGCNRNCSEHQNVTLFNWDPITAFVKCKCPYGFRVKVETPIGGVKIASENPIHDTLLTGTPAATN